MKNNCLTWYYRFMYNIKELKYSYIFYGYWECFIKKKSN